MKKRELLIFLLLLAVPSVSAAIVPDLHNIGSFYSANSSYVDFILITLFVIAAANITLERMYGRSGKAISILFGLMVGGAWAYYSATSHVSLLGTYSAPFLIFLGALLFLFFYEIFKAHNIKASVPLVLILIVVLWLWLQKYIENGQLRFLQPIIPWGSVIMLLSLILLLGYVVMMFRGGEGLPSYSYQHLRPRIFDRRRDQADMRRREREIERAEHEESLEEERLGEELQKIKQDLGKLDESFEEDRRIANLVLGEESKVDKISFAMDMLISFIKTSLENAEKHLREYEKLLGELRVLERKMSSSNLSPQQFSTFHNEINSLKVRGQNRLREFQGELIKLKELFAKFLQEMDNYVVGEEKIEELLKAEERRKLNEERKSRKDERITEIAGSLESKEMKELRKLEKEEEELIQRLNEKRHTLPATPEEKNVLIQERRQLISEIRKIKNRIKLFKKKLAKEKEEIKNVARRLENDEKREREADISLKKEILTLSKRLIELRKQRMDIKERISKLPSQSSPNPYINMEILKRYNELFQELQRIEEEKRSIRESLKGLKRK